MNFHKLIKVTIIGRFSLRNHDDTHSSDEETFSTSTIDLVESSLEDEDTHLHLSAVSSVTLPQRCVQKRALTDYLFTPAKSTGKKIRSNAEDVITIDDTLNITNVQVPVVQSTWSPKSGNTNQS